MTVDQIQLLMQGLACQALATIDPSVQVTGPVMGSAQAGGKMLTVCISPMAAPPRPPVPKPLTPCKLCCLTLLIESRGRQTGLAVLAEFARREVADPDHWTHGENTIRHALVDLASDGLIRSGRGRDAGYAILQAGRDALTAARKSSLFPL